MHSEYARTTLRAPIAAADDKTRTRRSFFGLAGGTALLCTIDGEELVVDSPESLGRADAAAARVRKPGTTGTAALVPLGTGILLLGGRDHRIEDNRISGNFLTGVAAIDGILLTENPLAVSLDRNLVRGNAFGRGGTDPNGRDVTYGGTASRWRRATRRSPRTGRRWRRARRQR